MRHLHDLRVRLQQRRNRVHVTDYRHYETELQLFLQFLDDNPYLNALLRALEASEEVDFEQWKSALSSRSAPFPPSETARAKLCLGILKECACDLEGRASLSWGRLFSHESKFNEMFGDLNEAVLNPLVNYLDDRIDDTGNLLYLLQRFKLKAEWFRKQEFQQMYLDNTGSGEAHLDRVLREALFDGGLDFPFSQPDSPSGRADVVSLGDSGGSRWSWKSRSSTRIEARAGATCVKGSIRFCCTPTTTSRASDILWRSIARAISWSGRLKTQLRASFRRESCTMARRSS